MASSYLAEQSSMIIEGFICPECQQDMSSVELLQQHFLQVHSANNKSTTNNQSVYNGNNGKLSNVFAKAKTLISNSFDQNNPFMEENDHSNGQTTNQVISNQNSVISSTSTGPFNTYVSNSSLKKFFGTNQSEGLQISHSKNFKQMRDQTVGRYVIQVNKLLTTLDKLITFDSNKIFDEAKRDNHFKKIVPWVQDEDVKLCPNCAKIFNILHRKHHCRLCGAIMCNQCSKFISLNQAKQLTDPDLFEEYLSNQTVDHEIKLRRSDSITSLNSYFFKSNIKKSEGDQHLSKKNNLQINQIYIRLCFNCSHLVEKKFSSFKDKLSKPLLINHYDELFSYVSEAKRLIPIFKKMSQSLNTGESIYQLNNAEEMRGKLIRIFHQAEFISGLILNFGLEKSQNSNSPKKLIITNKDQIKLQRNIRQYVINFLKENSFTLNQLPSKEDYTNLKARRQTILQEEMKKNEQIKMRQRKLYEETSRHQKDNYNQAVSNPKEVSTISIDNSNGWMPNFKAPTVTSKKTNSCSKLNGSDSENALKIQIQQVECYLDDALKNNKYEEAAILQNNLNELLDQLELN